MATGARAKREVRLPAVAGSFYPAEAAELAATVSRLLSTAQRRAGKQRGKLRALLAPHAGYLYAGRVAACAYRELAVAYPPRASSPHFVLIGPAHHMSFDGLACAKSNFWLTPLGKVRHKPAGGLARSGGQFLLMEEPHVPEHSLEVQLPFLQKLYGADFSITCFLTASSKLDFEKVATTLLTTYANSVFIFSSDLSHYLPLPQAEACDRETLQALKQGKREYLLKKENCACGAVGLAIALTMAKSENWRAASFCYDTSAAASGDESAVVGYAALGWYAGNIDKKADLR